MIWTYLSFLGVTIISFIIGVTMGYRKGIAEVMEAVLEGPLTPYRIKKLREEYNKL